MVGADRERNELVRSATPSGAHVQCAPLFFLGSWDAVVLPTELFLTLAAQRTLAQHPWLCYGPPEHFRSAWLAGAWDYLREPWTPEELFLRLRGHAGAAPAPAGLTAAEASVWNLVSQRRGLAVGRGVLAWASGCHGRALDTIVARLRTKLRSAGVVGDLVAVRGVGYRLS